MDSLFFNGFDFNVIDIETAYNMENICQVGVACVRESSIVRSHSWLVRPKGNKYSEDSMNVHHITPEMTENAPQISEIWGDVLKFIEGSDVVVFHNSSFDMRTLHKELHPACADLGNFNVYCSLAIAKYNKNYGAENGRLEVLAPHFDIYNPKSHDARYDAETTAKLFLKELELAKVNRVEELQDLFDFNCGQFNNAGCVNPKRRNRSSGVGIYKWGQEKKRASAYVGDESKQNVSHPFYKKSVLVTGEFIYSKEDIFQYLADVGALLKTCVSKKLDYIIAGDCAGPAKIQKLVEYNSCGCKIGLVTKEMLYDIIDKYPIKA